MSTTASELPILLFNEEFPTLTDALKISPAYQAVQITGVQAGLKYVTSEAISLFIISLRTSENLAFLATMVTESKKNNSFVKFIVINHAKHRLFDKTLIKLGILDIIEGSVTTKALRFKLDYALKTLNAQTKKVTSPRINWLPPIKETIDDMWILKSESDCKKINNKCLVRLMGPSPFIGGWVETDRSDQWEFSFKLNKDLFSSGSGRWLFEGQQKPKFIWDDNLWRLTGEGFELFYVENGVVHTRVKFKDRFLSITKNSQTAMMKEQLIIQSLDKNLLFKNGAEKLDRYEVDEGSVEKYENSKGKAKADHLTFDPLSGKGRTSDLSSPLLSLEIEETPQKKNKDATFKDPDPGTLNEERERQKASCGLLSGEGHTCDLSSPLLAIGIEEEKKEKQRNSTDSLSGKGKTSDLSSSLQTIETENDLQKKSKDTKLRDAIPGHFREENKKQKKSEAPLSGEEHTTDLSSPLLTLEVENNPQIKNKDARSEPEQLHDKKEKQRASEKELQSNQDSQRSVARDLFIQTEEEPFKKKNKDSQTTIAQENAELRKTNKAAPVAPILEAIEPKPKIPLEISAKEKFLKDFIKNKRAELQRKAVKEREGEQEKSLYEVEAKEKKARNEPEVNQDFFSGEPKHKKSDHEEVGLLGPQIDDKKPKSPLLDFRTLFDEHKEEVRPESLSDLKDFKQRRQSKVDDVTKNIERQKPEATSRSTALIKRHTQGKQELELNTDEKLQNSKVVKTKVTSEKKTDLDTSVLGPRDAIEKVLMGLYDNPTISVFLKQGDYAISGNFDDFFDQTLTIYTQLSRLKTNQLVIVSMSFRYIKKEIRLELEGSITDLTPIDNGVHLVSIQLTEKMIKLFKKMIRLFNERQKSIELFMQQARGF